ncbi:MOSC domain-containing protein [bacterium]|nr:MOSC domain-containing protein [bacterium]MBU1674472.1 MOSC domain-containing protein [bacterium]
MHADELELSSLSLYPLKAGRAVTPAIAHAARGGFAGDRRWLLTTASGEPVMLKSHPEMTRLRIAQREDGLSLGAPGLPELVVAPPGPSAARFSVTLKRDRIVAAAAGEQADAWFGELLGEPVRLAFMPHDVARPSRADPSADIGFAGDAPYLLVCEASLADLNARLDAPVGLNRFRANLSVAGGRPWQEDGWRALRIGGAVFEALGPCPRCPNTTVDPDTGATGAEPLRTLAGFRSREGKAMFGVFMGVREEGPVQVGDVVTVLS